MVPLLFLVATTTIPYSYTTANDTNSKGGEKSHNPQILPIVLVVSLLVLIFTLLAWYILRLKNQKTAVVTTVDKKIPNGILEEQEIGYSSESLYTVVPPEQQTVVLLPRSPSASKTYLPIPVDHLEEEYRLRSADDGKLFREEYNSLPGGNAQGTYEEANKDENKEKNRYPNILPYDHSRVVLTQLDGNPCSDYINASYVDGYTEKNKFIAAQGPKEETVADFWRMIWEQKVATVVMLTNLKERKEDKCYQYWPDQGCWTYGNVRVAVEDFTVLVDYTIRKFCVQHQASDAAKTPRPVTQLHFTSWPDFGVPFSPIGMLKFLKKVKAVNPPFSGPIVVHCSAGVGRTGTFIVIDGMIDMMHAEQIVDVFGFVSKIREQRSQLIQTDMQYSFVYQALLEYYLYGDTELDVSSLEGHLHKLHNTFADGDRVGLEEEFKKLTNMRIMKENMRTGNLPANMKKNRVLQIIPYDFNRVILSMRRGQEFTDYINASFIDGYRQKDYFIATQGPLTHTVEDFWRMVWEWKCHSIVMLTELQEREQDKCCQYWPTEDSATYGDYTVELKGDTLCETFSLRDLVLTFVPEKQTRTVRHFHFHGWPEIGIPAEGKGMIDIIASVQRQQQQSGNHPIVVHCSAGAGRTGTFIALSNILERVKAEGLLDVFQTVKSLRMQRPHMVQTVEQYDFCYRVVQDFVDIFSDYANFK
ncbi:receptor-type tyrosine-protein phosphatase epsilon isoform X1 [Gambusia affinis]|uniref:receptor-type tyrosine-protein phosphatase epsilon isoform X1 n=1 Tax=Gambusia affinis TaxID=33528 RepID=UPI001CDD5304|nr:receptor-type tyrosine-protein phosphatase epsilon isoform X1 [Gambusia affinis]XP_043959728.1 receptor-type tyrosine-protein phosphatase epsilon isoform X1 [Gambusia affinis]XP_043959729.1 receptor-type tyrosine-protein phosphatase epsilon isoform X1 [Gambusia affinis]XP_043959730.1 receptor-type tyrosine-protein phosphatase epsilon isoform X1 [Gambusia affinis]